MSEESLAKQIEELAARVASLEAQVAALEANREIPEEDMVVIGAAVAAYFGHKAKVRAVRFSHQSHWAEVTRSRLHNRFVPHIR